jgi:hypothetical protein
MSHIPEGTQVDVGFRRSLGPSLRFLRPQDMHRSPPQLYRKNSNANSNDPNIPMSVVDPSEDGATEPCGKDKYAMVSCLLTYYGAASTTRFHRSDCGCRQTNVCSTVMFLNALEPPKSDLRAAIGSHSCTFSCSFSDSTCIRLSANGESRTHATSHQTIHLREFTASAWAFRIEVAID